MERRIDPDKLIEYEEGLKIAEKNKLGKDLNSEDDSSLSIIIETAKRALATIREDLCYGSSKQVKRPTDGDKDEKIPDKLSVSGEMVI